MGFVNQSITQLRELFASMTPAARATAVLLLGVIGVSLGYLFQGYGGGSKEYLFNGEPLHPREVDAMETAIAGANLTESQRDGNRILVPRGRKAAYMKAIADAIPEAGYVVIPRAGHMSTMEEPAAVNEALAAFVTSLTRS